MPVFNVASTFGRKPNTSSAYDLLKSRLDILENELAYDTELSSGDYDRLIGESQKLYQYASPAQRNNLDVKISGYEKGKANIKHNLDYSLNNIKNDYADSMKDFVQSDGNNIYGFLQGKEYALRSKLGSLNQSVETLSANRSSEEAIAATISLRNEIGNVEDDLDSVVSALDFIENPTGKPKEGLGVFIKTNERGEILDIDVDRAEGKSGFVKTGDTVNGTDLQIYGNAQGGTGEKKIVKIGNTRYVQPDIDLSMFGQDPVYSRQTDTGMAGEAGAVDLSTVPVKRSLRTGEWAGGLSSGNLYQLKPNGNYLKYTGLAASLKKQELEESNMAILPINNINEKTYNYLSDETALQMTPIPPDFLNNFQPSAPSAPAPTPTAAPSPLSTSRTTAPVSRAPIETKGVAQRTLEAAKGFFSGFLNR